VRSVQTFHGIASNRVYSVVSGNDALYAGTLGGLSRISARLEVRNYSRDNSGLRHNWVNAVLRAGEDLWIGTYGGGVQRLQRDTVWQDATAASGQLHINPGALFRLGKLVLAGSLEAGLIVIRMDNLASVEVRSGLPSFNVTSFAADETHLYVGTDHGLIRYKISDLESLLEGREKR